MGLGHSTNNENFTKLQSRFHIVDSDPEIGMWYLVERRTNKEFMLRQLVTNQ